MALPRQEKSDYHQDHQDGDDCEKEPLDDFHFGASLDPTHIARV
jgi:hypothetical protein